MVWNTRPDTFQKGDNKMKPAVIIIDLQEYFYKLDTPKLITSLMQMLKNY